MKSEMNKLFADYQKWYKSVWLKKIINSQNENIREEFIEDFEKYGWMDALGNLKKINKSYLNSFEKEYGNNSKNLTNLFLNIGVGTILSATDYGEPSTEHEIIHPKNYKKEKANMLSWIGKKRFEIINRNYNFSKENFIPFLKLEDCCWVFFGNNEESDKKVYVFDHAVEDGIENVFNEYDNIDTYFQEHFEIIKKESS